MNVQSVDNERREWLVPGSGMVSHIRELIQQGTPIYGYTRRYRDYHDIDISENREDESQIRFPSIDELLKRSQESSQMSGDDDDDGVYTGLSGDSLAFTLVYVSVFTLTLLYVGVRLARRWRKKQRENNVQTARLDSPVNTSGVFHHEFYASV